VYGYPLEEAARVAWNAVAGELLTHGKPRLVRFVLFDDRALAAFAAVAEQVAPKRPTR
jgi:O-acetyl-ADP-ribose deacetylase (regulator of RNase III)